MSDNKELIEEAALALRENARNGRGLPRGVFSRMILALEDVEITLARDEKRFKRMKADYDAAFAVIDEARAVDGLQELLDQELEPEDAWRVARDVLAVLRRDTK